MMHEHPCAEVRERLEACYDGELTIDERIAIQNHLGECVACSLAAEELNALGASLREFAAQTAERIAGEPLRISAHVTERLGVEEQFSLKSQVVGLFQDMHLVWAGLGASMATLICIIGSASVLHAAHQQRPDSLASVISILANPGSNRNPMRLNYDMMAPSAVSASPLEMAEEDVQYALAAVVSREGRVQGVQMINPSRTRDAAVNAMLHEVYRIQFAPAQARGDAVAVSMVWLVANTTVKGRHDGNPDVVRGRLRAQTTPVPIGPLAVPVEAAEPKPDAASLMKPETPPMAFAAGG
jgi:hypothetical protein